MFMLNKISESESESSTGVLEFCEFCVAICIMM